MKSIKLNALVASVAMLVLMACNKSDEVSNQSIEGTYKGTLTTSTLKSAAVATNNQFSATTTITEIGDNEIEVHCFSDELDTTFMLNYYQNNDSIMVCLTGDDFEHMYGHMMGQGHMSGGMMGDLSDGETDWMHHLNDEHQADDEHFGGFDMQHHTFSYRFEMMDGDMPYNLTFQGSKK